MKNRMYAIENHKIVADVDVAPFSDFEMDKHCREQGFDGWFELDSDGAKKLMQVD